jgi:hypothetical protein
MRREFRRSYLAAVLAAISVLSLAGVDAYGADANTVATPSQVSLAQLTSSFSAFENNLATSGSVDLSSNAILKKQALTMSEATEQPNTTNWPSSSGTNCVNTATEPAILKTCLYGNLKSSKIVVLFGDSHMQQWLPDFSTIASQRGWKLVQMIRYSCGAALSVAGYASKNPTGASNCYAWRKLALQRIAQLHPYLIIFSGFAGDMPINATVAAQQERATDLTLINDVEGKVPSHVFSVVDNLGAQYGTRSVPMTAAQCLIRNSWVVKYDDKDNSTSMTDNPHVCYRVYNLTSYAVLDTPLSFRNALVQADVATGIATIDPRPWTCDVSSKFGVCPPAVNNSFIYFDINHLSMSFVRTLTSLVDRQLPLS